MSKSSFFSGTGVSTTNTTALESSTAAAAQSESAAAASATSAATSAASAASNVSDNVASAASSEASRQAALVAKTAAETAETNAETAQAAALISQNAAATSAASSETSKVTSVNSASTATTKASEASTSETNAAASAATATSKAADSETARAASVVAKDASVAAKDASVVAKDASVVAKNASVAAQAASETAETNSETAETNAASSASSASTSASTATTKASEASTSATASETSKVASEAAKDAALAALDSFDDRYLGSKSSAPTVDNDGDALAAGMLYFDTTSDSMKVYEGSAWVNAYASLSGALIATNNLSDLNNAGTARTNLSLGTAATTAATAYATAAQGTKVDGIEASADVTDTTNVTAAGALMDSELTSIASVKALNQGVATTNSPTFSNLTLSGTDSVKVPSGTTAQRPSSGVAGMFRYSSTLSAFEGYTTEWGEIGGGGSTDISLNSFTGDGSDVTFSLSAAAAENNTFVYIDGVYQSKSNYSVSAADPAVVTFSTPPPNTTAIEIMSAAISVSNIGTPSDNTVSTAKIVDGAVTAVKIADANVTTAKILDANVTTAKILDGAVTTAKLASTLSIQDLTVTGTGALKVASGTTAERPTAAAGQFRYNSTLGSFEGYQAGAWAAVGGGDEVTYGTFTPTLTSGTASATGSWMRVGDMVTVTFRLYGLSDTTSSSAIQIVLPFTCKSGIEYQAFGASNNSKQAYADDTVFQITHNTAYATPYKRNFNAGYSATPILHTQNQTANTLQGTLTYRVA